MIKKTFTFLETIVAIIIIVIFSVVGFAGITKRISSSRDTTREIDIKVLEVSLKAFYQKNNFYSLPQNRVSLSYTGIGGLLGYQGYAGDLVFRDIGSKPAKDPLDKNYYTYSVNAAQDKFAIMTYMESMKYRAYAGFTTTYAIDYSLRYPKIGGDSIGIITDIAKTPIQEKISGTLEFSGNNNTYNVYLASGDKFSGTGLSLQKLIQFMRNGYQEPKSCPIGFIPVPGNKEFQQAGFCVAKYEMKQKNGDAGYYSIGYAPIGRNTGTNTICGMNYACGGNGDSSEKTLLDGNIVSKADGNPIVWINIATSIRACNMMGMGYHLITNSEWTSIARNIESNPQNRNSGKVGSGFIFNGNKQGLSVQYWRSLPASLDDTNGCADGLGGNIINCPWNVATTGNNYRTLRLNNGQIIWDLAGNRFNAVNRADTIDGSMAYGTPNRTFFNVPLGATRLEWTDSALSGSIERYGPSNTSWNTNNGMGSVFPPISDTNDTVIRGGGWDGMYSGIYTFSLGFISNASSSNLAFRCAY